MYSAESEQPVGSQDGEPVSAHYRPKRKRGRPRKVPAKGNVRSIPTPVGQRQFYATRGEYEGRPVLSLLEVGNSYPVIMFGVRKARAILACLQDIHALVADDERARGGK